MEAAYPQLEQDPEAAEGDAAHWIVATVLRGGAAAAAGMFAPNGVVVTDEMLEAAEIMVDDVRERSAGAILHIEEFVWCPSVHPENGGTPDIWWIGGAPGAYTLHIYDFKYGHRFVDAWENWQCLDYASGILDLPELRGYPREGIQVEINVVQPRNFHPDGMIRRWVLGAGHDLDTFVGQMRQHAADADGPKPWVRVGAECRDCRGRHACQALHNAADGVADIAGVMSAVELPPEALGVELRMLERAEKLLDARLTGLREQAEIMIRQGKRIPFFQLKQGNNREMWTKSVEEIALVGELLGLQLTTQKPVTPAQARKLGVTTEIVAAYSTRPPGEFKLVPVTEDDVRKVFSK